MMIAWLILGAVCAQDAPARPDEKADVAIRRGLSYLVAQQDRDGAILLKTRSNRTALTALALLAMASIGHQPADDTPEGQCMKRALAYVLRPGCQEADGYYGKADGSRMYGHGIITLMLAEFLGMGGDTEQDRLIGDRCKSAVDLILRSQAVPKNGRDDGGWRYAPDGHDADLSISVWQVSALRSAKNAGIEVPKAAIDRAIEYIRRCYISPRDSAGRPTRLDSACAYGDGRGPCFSTAGAGLLSMQLCGKYEGPEVSASADWLMKSKLDPGDLWFYYGIYYYAQGMYQRGGATAETSRKRVEETLLSLQQDNGSWVSKHQRDQESSAGPVYCTSLAILALAVKHHFLPIYQR